MGIKEKIGCLGNKGLRVFQITSDGRYNISEDLFFDTHFPMTVKRERQGFLSFSMTEQDLLDEICDVEKVGVEGENRVYFLFGATGSGKSELSKWLEANLHKTDRRKVVHRISKSELDLPIIVQKFKTALHEEEGIFSDEIRRKQIEVGKKPHSTSYKLLYDSLYSLLENDEEILLAVEHLQPKLAEGIKQAFDPEQVLKDNEEERGEFIEPLSKEDFTDQLKDTDIINILGYEELNKKLVENIESILLEDTKLVDTLENLSKNITKNLKTRPVLLIDDIVQSMTFYVVSLLDYFMDFSRGHWDVVIGITPASLEFTQKGKELLNRITEQNTITERVNMLMLTDKMGDTSYVINEENCVDFIKPYLKAYKKHNGFVCGPECEYYQNCILLNTSAEDGSALTPFNSTLIKRIFSNLPPRTGQSRSIIRTIKNLLDQIDKQDQILKTIEEAHVIKPSFRAEYPADSNVEIISELYLPYSTGESIRVPKSFLDFFEIDGSGQDITVSIIPFEREDSGIGIIQVELPSDPAVYVINDWLDGKELSSEESEQLLSLRIGAVSIIQEFLKPNELGNPSISNVKGALSWKGIRKGTDPPLTIEGIDEHEGIYISKEIGPLAFLLHQYRATTPNRVEIRTKIIENEKLGSLLHAGQIFKIDNIETLSELIGMELERLVLYLYILSVSTNGPYETNPPVVFNMSGLEYLYNKTYPGLPFGLGNYKCELSSHQRQQIEIMFNDFFLLRTNIYDGYNIESFLQGKSIINIIDEFLTINTINVPSQFQIGRIPFNDFIDSIKKKIMKLSELVQDEDAINKLDEFNRINLILSDMNIEDISEIIRIFNEINEEKIEEFIIEEHFKRINYKYEKKLPNFVDIKEWVENINTHLYIPLIEQTPTISPTLFLRFIYEFRQLEDNHFTKWIINYDNNLTPLEIHLKEKIKDINIEETKINMSFIDNLELIYNAIEKYSDYLNTLFTEKIDLGEYTKKDIKDEPEINNGKKLFNLLERTKDVHTKIKEIISTQEKIQLLNSYNELINVKNIQEVLSWSILSKACGSELNVFNQIKFWETLIIEIFSTFDELTIDSLNQYNVEITLKMGEIRLILVGQYTSIQDLISEKQKVWEAIELIKSEAPETGKIFPISLSKCRFLIKNASSISIYNHEQIYKLSSDIVDFLKTFSQGGEDSVFEIFKKKLSDETYDIMIKILRDRKSVPLNELNLENIRELLDKFPELIKIISLSLYNP